MGFCWTLGWNFADGGRNPSGVGVESVQFHSSYHSQGGSQEMMGQSPPHSPRSKMGFEGSEFDAVKLEKYRRLITVTCPSLDLLDRSWLGKGSSAANDFLLCHPYNGHQLDEEGAITMIPSSSGFVPFRFQSEAHEIVCIGMQVHMASLHRPDKLNIPSDAWMQNATDYDDMLCEQGIPTMITWSYGGREVAVEGSWDNWKTKKLLQRCGKDFMIMKVLPPGVYQFRFIVDGEWRYAPDTQWVHDDHGNAYNILDLQDYVPEDLDSIAGFEPPQSPGSSYDNMQLGSEDYSKEPPFVPPQLQLTLLNSPSYMDNPSALSRPQHVVLDHLFVQKEKTGQSVVALGMTHRFRAKYVTVVLYKSLQM